MSTRHGNVIRYDAANPNDLAELVANGAVWSGPMRGQLAAVRALIAGTLPMPETMPPDVRRYVQRRRRKA